MGSHDIQQKISDIQPYTWASAIAAIAVAGTLATMTRRWTNQIGPLDPREPFDPYYGLAEYALSAEPAR